MDFASLLSIIVYIMVALQYNQLSNIYEEMVSKIDNYEKVTENLKKRIVLMETVLNEISKNRLNTIIEENDEYFKYLEEYNGEIE